MATQKVSLARLTPSFYFGQNDKGSFSVKQRKKEKSQIVKRRSERRIENDIPLLPTW